MMMDEKRGINGPSWLMASLAYCCSPVQACLDDDSDDEYRRRGVEKRTIEVLRDQPALEPPPISEVPRAAPAWPGAASAAARERSTRKSFSSARTSFSVRKRFLSNASSRRPQISAPSDFRHIQSDTFRFPNHQSRGRPSSFRPLELSIYLPENRLSPMMPHFESAGLDVAPPPAAVTYPARDDDSVTLNHERSYSSLSFHVPRRPTMHGNGHSIGSSLTSHPPLLSQSSPDNDSLPRPPPKARTRSYTSASVEDLLERIARATIERDRIQSQIDEVIERQSIYINSRPTTAYGEPENYEPPAGPGLPVMPNIPAMPPAAPSFAERLGSVAAAAAATATTTATSTLPLAPGPSSSSMNGTPPPSSHAEHHELLHQRLQQHQQQQERQQQQQLADRRPSTATPPSYSGSRRPVHIPSRLKPFDEAAATFHHNGSLRSPPPRRDMDRTPPPPLPLVLRPPLRKKKSFSRVSSWLNFQPVVPGSSGISILEQQHQRTGSAGGAGSITNAPRPLSGDEGFYQIVGGDDEKGDSPVELRTPVQNNRRHASVDSLSSLSSWDSELDHTATSDEDELEKGTQRTDDNHTVPTSAWSAASPADSSPATKTAHEQMPSPLDASVLDDVPPPTPPKDKDVAQAAVSKGPRPQSVGVAF